MKSSSAKENPTTTPRQLTRARRWLRRAVIVFIIGILAFLAAPFIIGRVISYKLRSEISARLNATLQLGRVTYLPPYGVRIDRARLIANDSTQGQVPIFDVGQIELELARNPLSSGPLVIQKIDIQDPLFHLVQTAGGLSGSHLAKTTKPAIAATDNQKKLSDLFELRRLVLSRGRIEYEDRSKSKPVPPVIWNDLEADLRTAPTSRSSYQFEFTASDAPLADIKAAGAIDIDSLLLDISRFSVTVKTNPTQPAEQLPPQLQAFCRQFAIAGEVTLAATARIPLNDLNRGVYAAQLSLHNGSCKLPNWDAPVAPVELNLSCGNSAEGAPTTLPTTLTESSPDFRIHLSALKIASGNQLFQIDTGDGRFTPTEGTWAAGHIIGVADLGDGPGPVHRANITTHIPFAAAGTGKIGPGGFVLRFGLDNASATFPPKNLPLKQIDASLSADANGLKVTRLTGTLYGGQVLLHGDLAWSDPLRGITYTGQANVTNIDMRQVANAFITDQKSREMASGAGELRLQFNGAIPPNASAADAFNAKADFDIRHGHFVDIPVLKDVLAHVKEADAATVGEAAATFTIAHRKIHFDQAAASAPAIGVLGNGQVGFDGSVNMTFIVTPLADWREKLASTDVPILSTIGAMVLGKVQHAVNVAERAALYQYRVTGSITDPITEQVPAPALTDAMKPWFQKMSRQSQENTMSQELRRQQQEPTSTPKTDPPNQGQ